MSRFARRLTTLALAGFLSLVGFDGAEAQKTSLPASVTKGSTDPKVYSNQLRMAARIGRIALEGLQNAPLDNQIPIDERVLQAARDTYVLIRAARVGVEVSKDTGPIPDPMLELAFRRLDRAFNLSRTPVDLASWGVARQDYLRRSIPALSEALSLVEQALILLP